MCALYAEELITARIVDRELQDHAPAVRSEEGPVTLSMLVERHLASHFADQPDGVPAARSLRSDAGGGRASADPADPVGHARQPGARRRDPRPQPQHLRKKIQDLGVEMTRGRRAEASIGSCSIST
jgi:two-component system nitrogen regulation response regulator GlnG